MSPAHRVYGLCLESARALPGFPADRSPAAERWRITLPATPDVTSGVVIRRADEPGNDDLVEVRFASPHAFSFVFGDGVRFRIDAAAASIEASWPAELSFEDALVYLVGPALGAALRLERRSVLHASAVDVNGRAVLVMGEGGAGKSTLTAAFLDAGYALITEDVASLSFTGDAPTVFRGGSRVKLWDESVVGLRGRADALPALVPTNADWRKKYLDAGSQMTARDETPIGAVYLLQRDRDCSAPRIEDVAPHERALLLIANSYGARLVVPDDRAAELARLSSLARAVPIRRLVYPNDIARLPEVVRLLASSMPAREASR